MESLGSRLIVASIDQLHVVSYLGHVYVVHFMYLHDSAAVLLLNKGLVLIKVITCILPFPVFG